MSLEDAQIAQKVEQVIQKAQTVPRKEGECVLEGITPFIIRIVRTEIPSKFKLPQLDQYDGTGDPITHISSFRTKMMLQNVNDGILCQVFPSTLTKTAQRWFHQLPKNFVSFFEELVEKFRIRFITNVPLVKNIYDLQMCKKEVTKSLNSYLDRFNKVVMQIENLNDETTIEAMKT